jgi:hypothetical protein
VTNILQNDGTLEDLYNKIDSLVLVNEIIWYSWKYIKSLW